MRVEIPEIKRCCFCMPLRRGLLSWAYLNLVFTLIMLFYVTMWIESIYSGHDRKAKYIVPSTTLVIVVMEIILYILFIIFGHRKNYQHMRMLYRYATVTLALQFLVLVGLVGFGIYVSVVYLGVFVIFLSRYILIFFCLLFIYIGLQVYFVIMMRSEILKLEKTTNFQFINHTSEPECKAQMNII